MKENASIKNPFQSLFRRMLVMGGLLGFVLSGCAPSSSSTSLPAGSPDSSGAVVVLEKEDEPSSSNPASPVQDEPTTDDGEQIQYSGSVDVNPSIQALNAIGLEVDPQLICTSLMVSEIPDYDQMQVIVVNEDTPSFSLKGDTLPLFEYYGELDEEGRCTVAMASIGPETLPDADRGDISSVKPTGFVQKQYDFVDNGYLYNRSHLIAYCLSAENDNVSNLVTGTRSMNLAMVPMETEVADYVKETGQHVLYRATPVFEGDNLVCSGILLEAQSIEDQGESISFCRYIYNVEPGVTIDYATGESWIASEDTPTYTYPVEQAEDAADSVPDRNLPVSDSNSGNYQYVANTNSRKFHLPSCSSVDQMAEHNKAFYNSREQLIQEGFEPCKICKP